MEILNVDCLYLIFNVFDEIKDRKTLLSCLLVNREWCRLIVPILWKRYPRSRSEKSRKNVYNTILSCLPQSSKQILFDNNIILSSTILPKLLFNYISFCKFLEPEIIINSVFKEKKVYKKEILEKEVYKLFVSQCKNIKELTWETSQPLLSFPGASTCFSQLCELTADVDFVDSDALHEMGKICKSLDKLYIYNRHHNSCRDINSGLISLIDAQRNLKDVTLRYTPKKIICKELGKALGKKANTISHLYLGSINIISSSYLKSLINLKDICIYSYTWFEIDHIVDIAKEFQKNLAISKFPKLQKIKINIELPCFNELTMLIENTEGNILDVSIYYEDGTAENTGMLIKSIADNCPKIKRLYTHIETKDFVYIKSLLSNCRNLERLELDNLCDYENESDDNIGDELLDILVEFSPKSLVNVKISENWKYSIDSFERFFESFRGRKLKHFDMFFYDSNHFTTGHWEIVNKYYHEGVIESLDNREFNIY